MTGRMHLRVLMVAVCLGISGWLALSYAQQPERSSLPIPDPQYKYPGKLPLDARDATFAPIKELRPPQGASNLGSSRPAAGSSGMRGALSSSSPKAKLTRSLFRLLLRRITRLARHPT